LLPFGEMLKGVRIIGLGEGSHGMREHFQAKHGLIRYLVDKRAIEPLSLKQALLPA